MKSLEKSLDLKTKITIGVSAVVILSLSLASYFAIAYLEKQIKNTIASGQFLMLSEIGNEIDKRLLFAHQQLILAARNTPPAALRDPEVAQRFLDGNAWLLSYFDNNIGLFSASGIEITESPLIRERRGRDFSFRPYFKKTAQTGKPIISDPYLSSKSHNHPAIMMTAPIYDGRGGMTGFLAGSMDLLGDNILGDISKIKIGETGYMTVTTADRIIIMHPNRERIMKRVPDGNKLYEAAVNGFEGTDETVTTAGIPMVTSYKRMKVNDWIIGASYPRSEAYAALRDMKLWFLGASILVAAFISVMIWIMIRRFTLPLAQFTRHVADLPRKQGDEKQVRLGAGGEIGTLARVFNTMVVELDRRQEALLESENLFRTLAEKSLVGVYLIQDGIFRYVNPRFAEIFGCSVGEITDKLGPRDLTYPEDWTSIAEFIRQRISGETKSVHYSFRGLGPRRGVFDAEVFGSATLFRGRPAIIGTLLDITERKRAEAALRESEERFRELSDSLPLTVFEVDAGGRFMYVNRAALESFGYDRADVERGLTVGRVVAPEDRERALRNMQARLQGGPGEQQEYLMLRKDGTTFPAVVHAAPAFHDGRLSGLRGILVDLTQRKRLEAEVLRAQKLESIGVMAGGIAHDFNNILTAILGNLSLIRRRVDPGDPLYQRVDQAEKASLHARDLTHQLLTFAKGGSPVKKVVELEHLIRDAAGLALRGSNARVEFRLAEGLSTVEADEGQLGQVFNNLFLNAAQAMPEGGTITVSAGNITLQSASGLQLPEGDYVRIQVEDQGMGIPPDHLSRVFDPYFTTKQKGSGLGLTIAYSVLKNHGGHIDAASTFGEGTTFTLYLPASAKGAAPPSEAAKIIRGKGRILVMDDEELVRTVVAAMLTDLGYEAAAASDGTGAVSLYRDALSAGRPFDAVIMDLTVPGGKGGKETIRELIALDPKVKAVVSSGYSEDPVMADFRSYGFSGVVRKPFRISELSELLHRVIRGGTE